MPFKLNPDLTISGYYCKRENIKAFCQSHPNYTSFRRSTPKQARERKIGEQCFQDERQEADQTFWVEVSAVSSFKYLTCIRKICSTDWKAEPGSKFGTLVGNYYSSVINLCKSRIIPTQSPGWKLSPFVSLWSF